MLQIDEVEYVRKIGKRQIRIIKHGTANNVLVSQAAITQREDRAEDPMELIRGISEWVTEFKERRRPNAKSGFQTLKEHNELDLLTLVDGETQRSLLRSKLRLGFANARRCAGMKPYDVGERTYSGKIAANK